MKTHHTTKKFCLSLISSFCLCSGINAAVFFDITSVDIEDSGSTQNLNSSSTYAPTGDADVTSFTISGGTTYTTAGFISGINVDSSDITAPGAVQPSDFLVTNDSKFTDGDPNSQFYTGDSQLGSFLAHGDRGLSLSTGINVTVTDPPSQIRFDAEIKDSSLLTDGKPDFLFGDGADLQSDDEVSFLDASNNKILSFVINGTSSGSGDPASDWSSLGTREIDRIEADGNGFRTGGNDDTREVSIVAAEIEQSDLTTFGTNNFTDFAAAMAAVTQIEVDIPASSSTDDSTTDYTFLGINLNAIDSDAAVVPEPSLVSLFGGLIAMFFTFARRRP